MEGFLDFKLPIYQRVLVTRAIAIVPAITVTFFNQDQLTNLDSALNILQSIQLPFALIPLIKFVSSPKIMGMFAIGKHNASFATFFGILLFALNFRAVFIELQESISWLHILLFVIYMTFIFLVISEPVGELSEITDEELEDQECKRLEVRGDGSDDESLLEEHEREMKEISGRRPGHDEKLNGLI